MKFLLFLALSLVYGPATADTVYMTGNKLRTDLASEKGSEYFVAFGYVMGVHDTNAGRTVCASREVKAGQLVLVVKKALENSPQTLHEPADDLVRKALELAFPCKK